MNRVDAALMAAGCLVTTVGGYALSPTIRKAAFDSSERGLYAAGMLFNHLQMHEKDLSKCKLLGDTAKLTDIVRVHKPQWANTVLRNKKGNSLVLMAQPTDKHKKYLNDNNFRIVSVQEPWEQLHGSIFFKILGLSFSPPTEKEDLESGNGYRGTFKNVGLDKLEQTLISFRDRQALSLDVADELADKIHEYMEKGNCAVHCKSGRGRSVQAIIFYLIKYRKMDIEDAKYWVCHKRRFSQAHSKSYNKIFSDFYNKCNPRARL